MARARKPYALGVGGIGLVVTLGPEADMGFSSGIWYPVFYAGAPAIAATAAFVHEREDVGFLRLLGVGAWFLAGSVLALAVAVVLALDFPTETIRSPVSAVLAAGILYLGLLLGPVVLAVAAA